MIDLHLTVTDPFSSSTGVRSKRPSEHFSAKTLDQLSSTSKKLVLKQKPGYLTEIEVLSFFD